MIGDRTAARVCACAVTVMLLQCKLPLCHNNDAMRLIPKDSNGSYRNICENKVYHMMNMLLAAMNN